MRSAALAVGIVICIACSVSAEESSALAEKLGKVMAAEEPCSLTYDIDAIKAFVEKRVKADDMDFAGRLDTETKFSILSIRSMTESSKVAFCTQEARVAKSFGFIK